MRMVQKPRFNYEAGQRIEITVLNELAPNKSTACYNPRNPLNYDQAILTRVFEEPKKVFIYTGKVIFVGGSRVEHKTSSYTGCFGTIVFLLDKE